MFTKDSICTLANIVIADPMQTNLFLQSCATQEFAASNGLKPKKNYCDQHPTNQFLPLAIKIFGCLHKQTNVFLHDSTNVIWNLKGLDNFIFFVLVTFLHQKISITLQRIQASSILNWVVVVGLITSQLPPL